MPIHVAPVIRSLEEQLESNGLIQTRDSQAVTIKKNEESNGIDGYLSVKVVPVAYTWYIRGTAYTAS